MKRIIHEDGCHPIKIWTDMVEDSALKQLKNISRLPFIHKHIAVMPDVHAGIGSTVGSVVPTTGAIVPSMCGVDIGCGMNAVRLSLMAEDLPESLAAIRHDIEQAIPLGKGGAVTYDQNTILISHEMDIRLSRIWNRNPGFIDRESLYKKPLSQLGSLGSGNHFIELCLDENKNVWIMLHSGSRGIGNMIGSYFIEKAKKTMERYYINLPDVDLSYFPEHTEDFSDYIEAVSWAQAYARENRKVMMERIVSVLKTIIPVEFSVSCEAVNCHQNYISRENHFGRNLWITRKGAISARQDQLGIIPGSMGDRSYIVRGKGNKESFCSCSHGAGRTMSRTEARKRFTLEDLENQTSGIECRKDDGIIDEIPGCYKNIDEVMENQADLVEIVHTLKQVLCVKGN